MSSILPRNARRLAFCGLCVLVTASGAAWSADTGASASSPHAARDASASSDGPDTAVTGLRRESQRQAALALGVSRGLADRTRAIHALLERRSHLLDKAFNFAVLMDDNFMVPPVVRVSRNVFAQDRDDLLRVSRQVIRIVRKERLAPGPLTWRTYLNLSPGRPYEVPKVLLPANKAERADWARWVETGYQQGVAQADTAFSVALNRLVRDYLGMLEYRRQVALGKIRPAIEAASERGVVIDEKRRMMRVMDGVRVLAKPARFAKPKNWEVVILDD